MTMIMVNIHEAKARLSEFLDAIAKGERVLICKRNQPIAELRAVEPPRTQPRPVGGGPHHFAVPDSFFDPLPDDVLGAFESGPIYPPAPRPVRVAERRPAVPYGAPRRRKPRR